MNDDDTPHERFVRAHTAVGSPPLLPEIRLHLATEVTSLWHATEAWLAARGVPPPFWAFAWCGGQAIARHLLDHPEVARGARVLDFAAGGGVVGIAAAKAGAASVVSADIDPFAQAASQLNASLNQVRIEARCTNLVGDPLSDFDLVTAGDICYERDAAAHFGAWLRGVARHARVLLGDPGRAYLPVAGLREVARYGVPTPEDLEGVTLRTTRVFELEP